MGPRQVGIRSLAALVVLLVAAACGSSQADEPEQAADPEQAAETPTATEQGPYGVETVTETFVDDSRPTVDPGGRLSAPTRTLETDLYVPDAPGPFPLIVQAHGFDGHPRKFTELATAWAETGYVVAVPAFPLTNDRAGAPRVLDDYANQPADVSFVIDEVLRESAADHPLLGGQVDDDRIGVAGHSLGGATTYGLVFNDCCRDDRVDAVALMSTLPLPFGDDPYAFEGVPMLLQQLTEDPIVPYDQAVDVYEQATAPKFLVSLEGGVHFEPYENAPSVHDEVATETTIAFWDAYLREDAGGVDRLVEAAESDVSRLSAEL
jgi:fermentation-respiration switch protein FrsA (DUF1100 family)